MVNLYRYIEAAAATSARAELERRVVAAEEARSAAEKRANQAAINATQAMSEVRALKAAQPQQDQKQQQQQQQMSNLQAKLDAAACALKAATAEASLAAAAKAEAEAAAALSAAAATAANDLAMQERSADGRVMILKWMLASSTARRENADELATSSAAEFATSTAALSTTKHALFKAEAATHEVGLLQVECSGPILLESAWFQPWNLKRGKN